MGKSMFDAENFGKLFIRLILGPMLTAKGVMFFVDGNSSLVAAGKVLEVVGVRFWPLYFGWAVAVICVICGVTFALGAFFKTTTFFLGTFSLLDAIFQYLIRGQIMGVVALTTMLAAVMYGFLLIGPGAYSVQK